MLNNSICMFKFVWWNAFADTIGGERETHARKVGRRWPMMRRSTAKALVWLRIVGPFPSSSIPTISTPTLDFGSLDSHAAFIASRKSFSPPPPTQLIPPPPPPPSAPPIAGEFDGGHLSNDENELRLVTDGVTCSRMSWSLSRRACDRAHSSAPIDSLVGSATTITFRGPAGSFPPASAIACPAPASAAGAGGGVTVAATAACRIWFQPDVDRRSPIPLSNPTPLPYSSSSSSDFNFPLSCWCIDLVATFSVFLCLVLPEIRYPSLQ